MRVRSISKKKKYIIYPRWRGRHTAVIYFLKKRGNFDKLIQTRVKPNFQEQECIFKKNVENVEFRDVFEFRDFM